MAKPPWVIAAAERQLREYADTPPGRLRMRLGEFYAVPDMGLPESDMQQWLYHLIGYLKRSIRAAHENNSHFLLLSPTVDLLAAIEDRAARRPRRSSGSPVRGCATGTPDRLSVVLPPAFAPQQGSLEHGESFGRWS